MFYRAFYVSYLLKVWVFVHVPSISPPIAAAPHQLRHYFVTYRNLHTSGPYSAAFLGQREPQQLQTEGLRGMSDARCGGRSDCKSCLAKSGGCSWCTYTDSTGAAAATCLFEDTANLCEDIRTVCPVAVESESSVAPIETVVGGAVGVAVGSCGLVFLFLYIMVRTFQQCPRMALVLTHAHTHTHTHTHRVRRYTARSTDVVAVAPGTATRLWLGEATRLHGGWRPSPQERRSTASCRARVVLQGHCCGSNWRRRCTSSPLRRMVRGRGRPVVRWSGRTNRQKRGGAKGKQATPKAGRATSRKRRCARSA